MWTEISAGRVVQQLAVRQHHRRQRAGLGVRQVSLRLLGRLHVQPAVGHLVARQEILKRQRLGRPAAADQAQAFEFRLVGGLPIGQQVVQHRVELLFGRVPGFDQVIVQPQLVDGLDGDVGVGIGGQQHALGFGEDLPGGDQELGAGHLRHALVDQHQGDRPAAPLERGERLERHPAGAGFDDAVALAVGALQVERHGLQHIGFVIHCQQNRLVCHPVSASLGGVGPGVMWSECGLGCSHFT